MFQQAPMLPIFDVRCVHRPNSSTETLQVTPLRRTRASSPLSESSGCHKQEHVGSKTLLQENPTVLIWRCQLMQVVLCNGCKMVVVVVVVDLFLCCFFVYFLPTTSGPGRALGEVCVCVSGNDFWTEWPLIKVFGLLVRHDTVFKVWRSVLYVKGSRYGSGNVSKIVSVTSSEGFVVYSVLWHGWFSSKKDGHPACKSTVPAVFKVFTLGGLMWKNPRRVG